MGRKFLTENDRDKLIARLIEIPKEKWIFKFETIVTCIDPDGDYDIAICSFMTENARVWTERIPPGNGTLGDDVRYHMIVEGEELDERTAKKLFYKISNSPDFFFEEVEARMMQAQREMGSFDQESLIIDEEPSVEMEVVQNTPLQKLQKYFGNMKKAA